MNEKRFEIQTNNILTKYIAEFNDDIKLSIDNLREKALLTSSIWAKWLAYLYVEKDNMNRIIESKSIILKKKIGENKNTDSVLRMKSENKIIENNETIQKLNKAAKITQDNIDYIERALNILQNFGFQIKNVTEVLKLNMSH